MRMLLNIYQRLFPNQTGQRFAVAYKPFEATAATVSAGRGVGVVSQSN